MADRVIVLDDYQGVAGAMADWSPIRQRADVVFDRDHASSENDLVARLNGATVVVAMRERTPVPAAVLERLPDLRLIVTTGMHNASIDMEAARARGIPVCGTGSGGFAAAELTWGLILSLVRGIPRENAALLGGQWQVGVGETVRGKTIGIIGLGRLGSVVAEYARAFGMRVIAWSENLTPERAAEHGAERCGTLAELMERADIVSVHAVLSKRTRGLIDAGMIARMRPDAYFVNTARAGIVDQDALRTALASGAIRGAALDVFEVEPLPPDSPWLELDNVVLTPHLGYVTRENFSVMYAEAIEDILAFWNGSPIRVLN